MSDETPPPAAPQPVAAGDLFTLKFLSSPRISPDGQQVAFVVANAHHEDNDYRAHIWLRATEGDRPSRRFTNGAKRDTDPHWSPDGRRLAFVSTRSGHPEIWVIPTDGGEASRLTHTPHGAGEPCWSTDGRLIAFVAAVGADDPPPSRHPTETEEARKARHEKHEKAHKAQPQRITRMKYKADGRGFLEDRQDHIWVVEVDDDGSAAGDPRQVTDGDWDDNQPAWSPDGRWIAFVSNRTDERDRDYIGDIWAVAATGGTAWQITASLGDVAVPAWSPDGTALAYAGHENRPESGFATNLHLYVQPMGADGHALGERRDCSAGLDRPVSSLVLSDMRSGPPPDPPQWTPDSRAIYYPVTDTGRVHLYRFDAANETPPRRLLDGDRAILNISLSADGGRLAYDVTDPANPGDLFTCTLAADGSPGAEQRLTHVNQRYLREHALAPVEELRFEAADGTPLQGWIMRTPGAAPGDQAPGVVEVHGGPHLLYGFAFFHEFQTLAAQGYHVFYMNPRGGQGYGEAFAMAIRNQWGTGPDYPDLMAGVDAFVATGAVDPDNLGLTGGSYGGYMTCWVVGHTNRFKTAVAQRSLTNMISFYGSSDIGWALADWEFGELFDTPDTYAHYWRISPLAYAPQIQTPLLLVHPENDLRCPIGESEQLYIALKRLGKTVELVRFPDASHGLSRNGKPGMRVHRLDTITDWMRRYLGGV